MLQIQQLETELKNGKLNSLYLLYGEETFLLETSLKKIIKLFGDCIKGINYILLDETNVVQLISNIETPAFGYPKKIIIVKNTGLFSSEGKRKNAEMTNIRENINDYIKNNIDIINESVVLVFVEEKADSRMAILKTIDKLGTVVKFDFQKPFEIANRLKSICHAYKVNVDNSALMYLIECSGTNMQELVNEIRKLIEYVGPQGTITKNEIDLLCTKKAESIIFDLTDSLRSKTKNSDSIQILNNLLYAKESIQMILKIIYTHFKKLYLTRLAKKENRNIAEVLNLKPNQMFLIGKYERQASMFKESELLDILQKLRDLDYKYKIGLIDVQIGLESILCQYS